MVADVGFVFCGEKCGKEVVRLRQMRENLRLSFLIARDARQEAQQPGPPETPAALTMQLHAEHYQ